MRPMHRLAERRIVDRAYPPYESDPVCVGPGCVNTHLRVNLLTRIVQTCLYSEVASARRREA